MVSELDEIMGDAQRARQRFDALPRPQQGFVVCLLVSGGFSGTVAQVRRQKHGRGIQDFEVEGVLKSLQEAGFIVKTAGSGGYDSEVIRAVGDIGYARTIIWDVDPRDWEMPGEATIADRLGGDVLQDFKKLAPEAPGAPNRGRTLDSPMFRFALRGE